MLYVVLRSGKVLKYNTASYVEPNPSSGDVTLRTQKGTEEFVACIRLDAIERIEPKPPCAVLRERLLRGRPMY